MCFKIKNDLIIFFYSYEYFFIFKYVVSVGSFHIF